MQTEQDIAIQIQFFTGNRSSIPFIIYHKIMTDAISAMESQFRYVNRKHAWGRQTVSNVNSHCIFARSKSFLEMART